MLLVALLFVWRYGSRIPYLDELFFVPVVTGEWPFNAGFLWGQHNEHRNPIPKLIFVGLYKLTGCDSRSVMTLTVLCLAGTSLALIWVARALRGWTSYTDAFFPLVLLQLGHHEKQRLILHKPRRATSCSNPDREVSATYRAFNS